MQPSNERVIGSPENRPSPAYGRGHVSVPDFSDVGG